jgi:hypothetical protein
MISILDFGGGEVSEYFPLRHNGAKFGKEFFSLKTFAP